MLVSRRVYFSPIEKWQTIFGMHAPCMLVTAGAWMMSSSSLLASKIPGEIGGDLATVSTSWGATKLFCWWQLIPKLRNSLGFLVVVVIVEAGCHLTSIWGETCLMLGSFEQAMVGWLAEAILITLGPSRFTALFSLLPPKKGVTPARDSYKTTGPGTTPRFFSILKSSFLWNL